MAEDNFQKQNSPDYAFDSYLNETTTFNSETNRMADRNPVHSNSTLWDSYFNNPMTFSIETGNGVFNNPMTFNNETGNGVFNNPMIFNTETGNRVFNNPMTLRDTKADNQLFPNGDEPLTLNLASTVAGNTFDVQNPDVDEPTLHSFTVWKKGWDERMLLFKLKREGKNLEDIMMSFQKMETRNGNTGKSILENINTRKSMLQRAKNEIEALGRAAAADREGEADRLEDLILSHTLGEAVRVDYDGLWDRISRYMKDYGSGSGSGSDNWSSPRVKYAWNHGASVLFPHIPLR